MRPDDLREEDDGAARPDHDVPDLEGLVAERDRVRAEVERLRREKREAEIELSILKGALDLVGKERGADCLCSMFFRRCGHVVFRGVGGWFPA